MGKEIRLTIIKSLMLNCLFSAHNNHVFCLLCKLENCSLETVHNLLKGSQMVSSAAGFKTASI